MKKLGLSILPALFSSLALFGSQASATTVYDVSDAAGGLVYEGSITTDGNTGVLSAGDIQDWH